MNRLKSIIGIGLIILAVSGLVYWEMDGRERLLTDMVLVANQDIPKDGIITTAMISSLDVMHNQKIRGAIEPEFAAQLINQRARQFIPQKAQLTLDFFYKDEFYLKADESIYVIKPDWISMLSSSVRQGDWVSLYTEDGLTKLGSFQVAFVKDAAIREVKTSVAGEGEFPEKSRPAVSQDAFLSRVDGTSVATHIEIIATLAEYRQIQKIVGAEIPGLLLVVQESTQSHPGGRTNE